MESTKSLFDATNTTDIWKEKSEYFVFIYIEVILGLKPPNF